MDTTYRHPSDTFRPASIPPPPRDPAALPAAERIEAATARRAALDDLGDRIAELAMQISAATYQLLVMIREFDEAEGWEGFPTCAHWLSWRTGLALGPAREKIRVARALAELPRISESMRTGRISYSKVRALTRIADAENEGDLLEVALAGTATHVESLVRAWRRAERLGKDTEAALEAERHESRYLDIYPDEDGMFVVRGRLEPEAGAMLLKALEAGEKLLYQEGPDPEGDQDSAGQRRVDAIGVVAEVALSSGFEDAPETGTRGDRYQVVVHVDAQVLEESETSAASTGGSPEEAPGEPVEPGAPIAESTVEGLGVPAGTSRRIACDASRVIMTHGPDGSILDVGRKTRAISPALRRALAHRDGCCRFPGCTLTFCDAHHVEHWADGGETNLDNLLMLCKRHHRAVHEEGYSVRPAPDGTFHFFRPDGLEIPQAPPLPTLRDDAITALVSRLLEAGADVDWTDNYPLWDGGRLDLGYALEALMPQEE